MRCLILLIFSAFWLSECHSNFKFSVRYINEERNNVQTKNSRFKPRKNPGIVEFKKFGSRNWTPVKLPIGFYRKVRGWQISQGVWNISGPFYNRMDFRATGGEQGHRGGRLSAFIELHLNESGQIILIRGRFETVLMDQQGMPRIALAPVVLYHTNEKGILVQTFRPLKFSYKMQTSKRVDFDSFPSGKTVSDQIFVTFGDQITKVRVLGYHKDGTAHIVLQAHLQKAIKQRKALKAYLVPSFCLQNLTLTSVQQINLLNSQWIRTDDSKRVKISQHSQNFDHPWPIPMELNAALERVPYTYIDNLPNTQDEAIILDHAREVIVQSENELLTYIDLSKTSMIQSCEAVTRKLKLLRGN